MASWNDKNEGNELEPCPVCGVQVLKKKRSTHLTKCAEKYEDYMEEAGVIKCPLYPLHIFPKIYLNHHLEGNCEEAQNLLRKYFQSPKWQLKVRPAPEHFLAEVPDEILNKHNKHLLFILRRDLKGNDISFDENLFPPEERAPREANGS